MIPEANRYSRYSVPFMNGVAEPDASRTLDELCGELVHHHAAVLAIGDLSDQRRHALAGQRDKLFAS